MPLEDAIRAYSLTHHSRIRSRYHESLGRIEDVFAQDNVYVGIYETMFLDSSVERLSKSFNLEPRYHLSDNRVNSARDEAIISTALMRELQTRFKPIYDYCFTQFPELRAIWRT